MALPNRTHGQTGTILDGVLSGTAWDTQGTNVITWGLFNSGFHAWPSYSASFFDKNYFNILERYINVDFQYLGTFTSSYANVDISFEVLPSLYFSALFGSGNIDAVGMPPSYAFSNGYLNSLGLSRDVSPFIEGAIAFNQDSPVFYFDEPGQVGYATVLHELGHALGLKHPHDNGFAPFVPAFPTFDQLGIEALDNSYITIMSYEPPQYVFGYGYPISPMALDVAALQFLYGPNLTTALGDDIYYLANSGVSASIWDVGGVDALDASRSFEPAVINLQQGYASVIGITATDIALGAVIENAVGSSFNDFIVGNSSNNLINGEAGNDTIFAYDGNDIVIGAGGNDIIYGNINDDQIGGGIGNDTLYGGQQADTIWGESEKDVIYGNFQNDFISGGVGADTIFGGQHDDVLFGDEGNDALFGNRGNDIMSGGSGADVFRFNFASDQWVDIIADFNPAEGDQVLVTNTAISPSTTSYSAELNATLITSHIVFDLFEYLPGNVVVAAGSSPNQIVIQGGDFSDQVGASILFL